MITKLMVVRNVYSHELHIHLYMVLKKKEIPILDPLILVKLLRPHTTWAPKLWRKVRDIPLISGKSRWRWNIIIRPDWFPWISCLDPSLVLFPAVRLQVIGVEFAHGKIESRRQKCRSWGEVGLVWKCWKSAVFYRYLPLLKTNKYIPIYIYLIIYVYCIYIYISIEDWGLEWMMHFLGDIRSIHHK